MTADPEILLHWLTMTAGSPLMLGLLLALFTFVSEDASLIAGSLLVGTSAMEPLTIILWLTAGITIGDVGLYGAGRLAQKSRFVRRRLTGKVLRRIKRWLKGREMSVLFLSRFLPGTRLPTYLAFGFLKLSLWRFTSVMLIAGLTWVTAMVLFVSEVQKALSGFGAWVGLAGGLLVAFIFLVLLPPFVKRYSHAPDLGAPKAGKEFTPSSSSNFSDVLPSQPDPSHSNPPEANHS